MTAAPLLRGDEEPLLKLARALFAQAPVSDLEALLRVEQRVAARLSPDAGALLEESLGKGAVLFLARAGAARSVGGKRLWDREALPPLHFTGASLKLLRWLLLSGEPSDAAWVLPKQPLGSGDEVLFVAALETSTGTAWQSALAYQPVVRGSALCAVGFAAELGAVRPLDEVPALDLRPGAWHAFALEALGEQFAHRWAEAEFEKTREALPPKLKQVSVAQGQVLDALLAAATDPGNRAPLGFLLEAGKTLLASGVTGAAWGSGLSSRTPLRERFEARKASGVFLRALLRLRELDSAHREVRFTDDGYEAARVLVARWEAVGPTRAQWAAVESLLAALDAA